MSACGGGDSGEVEVDLEPFFLRDSSGVVISLTAGELARRPLNWTIDPDPDLVLGDDSESEYFYRIQGIRGLPDGRILVVDGGSRELRFYGPDGVLLDRAGGRGEGPGEFQDPVLPPSAAADSLLVFDKRLPRLQVLSEDGRSHRTILYPDGWPNGRLAPVGIVPPRHLLFDRTEPVGGWRRFSDDGPIRMCSDLFWFDPVTGQEVGLDIFEFDWAYTFRGLTFGIPFGLSPPSAVTDSTAFIAYGHVPEVSEYDLAGILRRVFRIVEPGRPITEEMVDAVIDLERIGTAGPSRSTYQEAFAAMPMPDFLPAFNALKVDELGYLWAQVYEWDPTKPTGWIIFDRSGRAQGTIHTPSGLEVEWIGEDRVLGVWRDDFDREYLHVHVLNRAADATSDLRTG